MLISKGYNFYGTNGTTNTISTLPINIKSPIIISSYKEFDWVAPEYEGVFELSPFFSGIGRLSFSDKDDDIFVWYGDFSLLDDNGHRGASALFLQDGKNSVKFSDYVVGLEVLGGRDEDRVYNARRVNSGDGDDVITADGIDLSDGIRSWAWLNGEAGDDSIILKDTTGMAHIIGGKGEDYVSCSMMTWEIIHFYEGDSLKEDGTLGEDTVYLFYRGIDTIRLVSRGEEIDFDDIVQTLRVDENGEHYINAKVEDMDVNINIYTDDTSTELLIEEDFIFQ